MKLTIRFNHAGDPCLGLIRDCDLPDTVPDFSDAGFPILHVADDVDVEYVEP